MANHIKLFNQHSEYLTFTAGQDFVLPNVSHCIQEDHVHYNPLALLSFLDEQKKMIGIPYTTGMTSQVLVNSVPSNKWYHGFVKTPISYLHTDGKTKDEIDALLGDFTRTSSSRNEIDVQPGMVYKTATFSKEYVNNVVPIYMSGKLFNVLFCIPDNIFRQHGIVINEEKVSGFLSGTYSLHQLDTGESITVTTQDMFGLDGYFSVVSVSSALENVTDTECTIRPYFITYDNVEIQGPATTLAINM